MKINLLRVVPACTLLLCVASSAHAVIQRTGQAYGRYGSGNTIIGEGDFPGGQLGADDTTGFFSASNATIDVGAQGFIAESVGVLSAFSGFDAASGHPNDPLNYFIAAGGGATLVHTIDVTSGTLAQFTPVQVRFKLAVAFDAGVLHSYGTPGTASNNAFSLGSVQANVTGLSGTFLGGNDNKVVKSTLDGTDIAVGLFAGAQETEFVINSEVGGSITFALVVDADANGDVSGVPSPLENRSGQGWTSVAVAYGAGAANGEDIALSVTGPSAAFPDLSAVNLALAATNLPINPYVPASSLVGDLDGDGFVGIGDLNIVLSNWNQSVPPGDPAADPSGDGFVGIEDLNVVLGNWNAGTPPIGATVPEPTSAMALMVGMLVPAKHRRRRR